ncbi:MAG: tetratricopeptide repeat protein, partial [Arenibacterium sp.]
MPDKNRSVAGTCRDLLQAGNFADVVALAHPHLQDNPLDQELWSILGRAFFCLGAHDKATLCFRQVLDIAPNSPDTLCDLGDALKENGQLNDAIACYNLAFELAPDHHRPCVQLGSAMATLNRHELAAQFFERATIAAPDNPLGHFNLAVTLEKLGATDTALRAIDKAIAIGLPGAAPSLLQGTLLRRAGALSQAADAFDLASKLEPDNETARAEAFQTRALLADWRTQKALDDWLDHDTPSGTVPPFLYLSRQDDAARQLARSRAFARAHFPNAAAPLAPHAKPANAPIRIGYFSTDYHDHAVMRLMGGLFAAHDRSHVEIIAYSYDLAPEDDMRRHVMRSVDAFKDVSKQSDTQIAQLAREDQIDI